MFYGYALYYKDRDGFELPLFHRHALPDEIVLITPYKEKAQKWLDDEVEALHKELNPKPRKATRGFWLWKYEETHHPDLVSAEEFRFKAQVYNTIFIKKVKLV